MHSEKRLSVVMTGRNDNYGGDFKTRLENCILSLFEQLNRYAISSEIIFVNYNPLPSPDIENFIRWPKSSELVQVKIITVPPEIHQQFVKENKVRDVPVNEYLGKNVGIRRAKGEYILAMNPDILFPDKLIKYFANKLNPNFYYRADRIDFNFTSGKKKEIHVNLKGHTRKLLFNSNYFILSCLRFQNFLVNNYKIFSPNFEGMLNYLKKPVYYDSIALRFHCKTSGDFMLMDNLSWHKTRSYFETANISLHVDSLFVFQVAMFGLKEKNVGFPIYHQEHERRFSADNNNSIELEAYQFFVFEANEMYKLKKNKIFNNENWGLSNFDLHEINL